MSSDDQSVSSGDASQGPPPRAPLGSLRPVFAVAGLYGMAALGWLAFGESLPGARWHGVHLFTLGVVSNLVVGLTHHFAQTVLHAEPRGGAASRFAVLNVGVVAMLLAGPGGGWAFALGAMVVVAVVAWLYLDLRRMRKQALAPRFGFVVRAYERACGAFLHGSAVGILVGVGVLGGSWYQAGRLAHLHLNVLGWGGLTLLGTVVFFAPTMMRTPMQPGADTRAAPALRHGTMALTVAALLLLASGVGGTAGGVVRVAAGAVLAGYAAAATVVCRDVVLASRRAKTSISAWMISAASVWLVAVVWTDVAVVLAGRWSLLDALGAALLVPVLAQAILASTAYLAPMLAHGGPDARAAVRSRVEVAAPARLALFNLGALAVVLTAALGGDLGAPGAVTARVGWALLGGVVLVHVVLLATAVLRLPIRRAP